jgi:hypothetical protein
MKKQQRWKFKVGTKVRVRGVRRGAARIEQRHPGIAHGAVFLDEPIDGTQWWNEDALVRVQPRRRRTLCGSCRGTGVTAHLLPCPCRRVRR